MINEQFEKFTFTILRISYEFGHQQESPMRKSMRVINQGRIFRFSCGCQKFKGGGGVHSKFSYFEVSETYLSAFFYTLVSTFSLLQQNIALLFSLRKLQEYSVFFFSPLYMDHVILYQ